MTLELQSLNSLYPVCITGLCVFQFLLAVSCFCCYQLFSLCNFFTQVWDLGGQDRLRTSWATYFRGTHAVIVVIDSTDRARITVMKDELFRILQHDDLQSSIILVFANKQDLKDAMSPAEITDALSLHSIKNHDWHIQACSALTGDGLYDGLGWIAQSVSGTSPS
uniref:ADP-ribosylation factor-like protein 5 n=1 Tax=Kalanchoe fedtschenkoi TaxID=63787 RepID=A0A7N0V9E2_KALFE